MSDPNSNTVEAGANSRRRRRKRERGEIRASPRAERRSNVPETGVPPLENPEQ